MSAPRTYRYILQPEHAAADRPIELLVSLFDDPEPPEVAARIAMDDLAPSVWSPPLELIDQGAAVTYAELQEHLRDQHALSVRVAFRPADQDYWEGYHDGQHALAAPPDDGEVQP